MKWKDHAKRSWFSFGTLISAMLFWNHPLVLVCLLGVLASLFLLQEKNALYWKIYLVGFVGGPLAETPLILMGAWEYQVAHLFVVPLWLPFLWGSAGLFFVSFYDTLRKHSFLPPD